MRKLFVITAVFFSLISCSKDDEDILSNSEMQIRQSNLPLGTYIGNINGIENYTLIVRQDDFDLLVTRKSVYSDLQLRANTITNIPITQQDFCANTICYSIVSIAPIELLITYSSGQERSVFLTVQ